MCIFFLLLQRSQPCANANKRGPSCKAKSMALSGRFAFGSGGCGRGRRPCASRRPQSSGLHGRGAAKGPRLFFCVAWFPDRVAGLDPLGCESLEMARIREHLVPGESAPESSHLQRLLYTLFPPEPLQFYRALFLMICSGSLVHILVVRCPSWQLDFLRLESMHKRRSAEQNRQEGDCSCILSIAGSNL